MAQACCCRVPALPAAGVTCRLVEPSGRTVYLVGEAHKETRTPHTGLSSAYRRPRLCWGRPGSTLYAPWCGRLRWGLGPPFLHADFLAGLHLTGGGARPAVCRSKTPQGYAGRGRSTPTCNTVTHCGTALPVLLLASTRRGYGLQGYGPRGRGPRGHGPRGCVPPFATASQPQSAARVRRCAARATSTPSSPSTTAPARPSSTRSCARATLSA